MKRHAFTLIEIMVVLVIIAVMAAIITPLLLASKSKAKSTVCISNLHQIFVGFDLYASDNNGWEVAKPSFPALQPYTSSQIFKCPEHEAPKYPSGYREVLLNLNTTRFTPYPVSYGFIRDYDPLGEEKSWLKVLEHPSIGLYACPFHGSVNPSGQIVGVMDLVGRDGPINRVCIDGHAKAIPRRQTDTITTFDLFYNPESIASILYP